MSQNSMFPHIVVFLLYITVVVQALSSGSDNLSSTRNAGPSVKIEKDLYVAGMITSTGLHANNVLLQGEMKVAGGVTANAIKADKLTVESLSTSNIQSSRSDGVINIDGNLVITSHHRPQALSLLAEELVISGIKQWRLVRHDSFQPSSSSYVSSSFSSSPLSESAPKLATEGKGKASESTMSSDGSKKSIDGSSRQGDSGTDGYGWSLSGVSSCSQGQHRVQEEQYTEGTNHSKKENQKTEVYRDPNEEWFLGGPCVIADGEVRKTFTDLPPHTQIKVTAQYHFIDNWQGETGYAKIEGTEEHVQ